LRKAFLLRNTQYDKENIMSESYDDLYLIRHTAAHVLAQAVLEFYPEAKLGIGPPIEDGF
jgi:threonyl-tRNA synthetase